jgi:hypothetical protein
MSGKSIDYSFISSGAGMPFKKGTWKHLQDAYHEDMKEILRNILGESIVTGSDTLPVAIWGCRNTGTGGAYDVANGAILFQGRIYPFSSDAFTPAGGETAILVKTTTYYTSADADPVTFTDLSTHNVHKIETISIQSGATGTGWFDYSELSLPAAKEEPYYVGITAGAAAFTSSNVVNDPGGTYAKVSYLRDNGNNTVTITGVVKVLVYPDTSNSTVFTLPAGFRPILEQPFTTYVFGAGGTGVTIVTGTVKANGDVILGHTGFAYTNVFCPFQVTFRI